MTHYIHDEKNNRIEGMSKEEIYALIDTVIETGELPSDVPAAFVTALKSIVDGKAYKIGFCTQAEYNQLEAQGQLVADALYIITDDTTEQDLEAAIENLEGEINDLDNRTTTNENNIGDLQIRTATLEGKHLYKHNVYLSAVVNLTTPNLNNVNLSFYVDVITTSNSEIKTIQDLYNAIGSHYLVVTGYMWLNVQNFSSPIVRLWVGSNSLFIYYLYDNYAYDCTYATTADIFTDTITTIY